MTLIIADSRISPPAAEQLARLGNILWLEPQPTVYESIAAHPDIFFCQKGNLLFASPDIPARWESVITASGVMLLKGTLAPGRAYPETARYNAVFARHLLIHNRKVSDKTLIGTDPEVVVIHVNQAYTRCNLLHLSDNVFLTSDKGIAAALSKIGMEIIFINPRQILLPGHPYGFAGGCFGVFGRLLVCNGNPELLQERGELLPRLKTLGMEMYCLHDGPLTDVGGIFFTGN